VFSVKKPVPWVCRLHGTGQRLRLFAWNLL
jgi:hypothetical protein